jgi:hypothetical protein
MLSKTLSRVSGTVSGYTPAFAQLDLGSGIKVGFAPRGALGPRDLGAQGSVFASYTFDGMRGWDIKLMPRL